MQELAIDVEQRRPVSFHVDYMRVPQLVVQGLSDIRSPKSTSRWQCPGALCHAEGCCTRIYLRQGTAAVRLTPVTRGKRSKQQGRLISSDTC